MFFEKKDYEEAVMEIISIGNEDVIRTSGIEDVDGTGTNSGTTTSLSLN